MGEFRITRAEPRDIFLHLLAIIALYVAAGMFLVLIFSYINLAFPDNLNYGYYNLQSEYSSIRWSIATLVVVFPVYVLVSWFLNREYDKAPEKRSFRIRKWLINFTLFVAAIIILGDLVTLVYNFLGGEITIRFVLKILTVLFVAGSTFAYYLWDLRRFKERTRES
jgi:hypothetical protein